MKRSGPLGSWRIWPLTDMKADWWVGNPRKEASVETGGFEDEQRDGSIVAGTTVGKHKASEQKAQSFKNTNLRLEL